DGMITGSGAALSDGLLSISAEGAYILRGDFSGSVVVEAPDDAKIQLVLDGVSIAAPSGPALLIRAADKVFLTLAEGSENSLSDSAAYAVSGDDENVDAALFSRADLTINGAGTLTIAGNYKHGVVSKDDLVVTGGSIRIKSVSTALSGKDCVKISGGTFVLEAGAAGIKSENEEEGLGYVYICGGSFTINAGGKGIMGYAALEIAGGDFGIVSADDALHTNGSFTLLDGTLTLASGDDGIHADGDVAISGGTLTIRESYEGIEGANIAVSGGNIRLVSRDDGLNAAGGADASGFGGGFGGDRFAGAGDYSIVISGGYLYVDASGDGLDSNGSLTVSGGVTLVSGPVNDGNGAIDYMAGGSVTGGVVVAAGSSGMAEGFVEEGSAQCSLLVSGLSASGGTRVTLADAAGNVVVSFVPAKDYASLVVSAPALVQGETYTLYMGGDLAGAGTDANGYAASGTLSGGTAFASIELDALATRYGSGGFGGSGGFPGGNPGGGNQGGGFPGGGGRPGN
ncbi:MAG TPA: carbohydrate-binding domain-containing protein, partial [Clostridia bacterium]|nr:carbohydrate-binding domain-containing protein [Clostridia bacterium]